MGCMCMCLIKLLFDSPNFRTQQASQSLSQSISRFIADLLFSVFMELLFLVQVSIWNEQGVYVDTLYCRMAFCFWTTSVCSELVALSSDMCIHRTFKLERLCECAFWLTVLQNCKITANNLFRLAYQVPLSALSGLCVLIS